MQVDNAIEMYSKYFKISESDNITKSKLKRIVNVMKIVV